MRVRDGRISAESGSGVEEGDLVVGRGGWLRLPEEFLLRVGIRERARAHVDGERIVVTAVGERPEQAADEVGERPAAAGGVAIEARAVTKRYGETAALGRVDATFERGRLAAVTGPSGSGKTTLLHVNARLELPDEGEDRPRDRAVVGAHVLGR